MHVHGGSYLLLSIPVFLHGFNDLFVSLGIIHIYHEDTNVAKKMPRRLGFKPRLTGFLCVLCGSARDAFAPGSIVLVPL